MSTIIQRAELQAKIWKIANEVRGAVDGWDFKQFVLGTLFYRFISEIFLIISREAMIALTMLIYLTA